MNIRCQRAFHLGCVLMLSFASVHAQSVRSQRINVFVVDENGVGVADARVEIKSLASPLSAQCRTGPSGVCALTVETGQSYKAHVEKENYYATDVGNLRIEQSTSVEFTLVQQREVREVVDVVESLPGIDSEKTSAQEALSGIDIIDLPYPTTRDYRNAMEYIPQVVNDAYTQPHITGAETYQTLVLLDGFNVTQPANGQLLLRVSTDSFRSLNVQTSRISAERGKSSGGVIGLNTGTGNDHFRFTATDFTPSAQNKHGWTLDKLTPRLTLSGPIRKGRVWFFNATDGEYDNIVLPELLPNPDHDVFWRAGNLSKLQANLTSRNILTTSSNVNFAHDQHSGMSLQNPAASTPSLDQPMYQGSVKDQYYFKSGQLLETGFGFNRYDLDQVPRGTDSYFVNPDSAGGSYYFTAHTQADRWQIYSNLFFKPVEWHGQHQFKAGVDLDRLRYDFNFQRQPVSYLLSVQSPPTGGCATQNYPCSRHSSFSGPSVAELHNAEVSGYAQDRWLVTNRFLIEAGFRFDWDEVIRSPLVSPRLAVTYVLSESGNTKFSAGIGVFHGATPLFLVARPDAGERTDNFYFYPTSGSPYTTGPVTSVFSVSRATLEAPRYLNWSLGLEQKLPGRVYLKAEFIEKRSTNSLAYNWLNPVDLSVQGSCTPLAPCTANFQIGNGREDHFDSFEINLRRAFEKGYMIMGSYVRSKSHTSQVLDFNVDNPVFSIQQPGPFGWDAPNRFLSWGFLPLGSLPIIKHLDFAYSTEYRTGFPFYLVNNQQQLAPMPGTQATPAFLRFPQYFTLNAQIEKRFHAFGFYWALRGGFDNITGRKNYGVVNNDVDSPKFLTFSGYSGRAFTARIRFLGRK